MKFKKPIVTLMAPIASIATVATLVSCGTDSVDLRVGVRDDEIDLWTPIAKKFEKLTGKKVELIAVSSMTQDYANWNGSDAIPNVTIADGGAREKGEEQKWFQNMDLKDIFSNDDYKIGDYNSMDTDDPNQFNSKLMNWAKDANDKSKYDVYPAVIGPSAMYILKKYIKPQGHISRYVVNVDASGKNSVVEYNPTNAPTGEGTQDLTWTNADEAIQIASKFISNSIKKLYSPTILDLQSHWYSIGNAGLYQRIYSAAKSIFKTPNKATWLTDPYVFREFLIDSKISVGNNGYAPNVMNSDNTQLDDKKAYSLDMSDKTKWYIGNPAGSTGNDASSIPVMAKKDLTANPFMMQPYYSYLGYFTPKSKKDLMSSKASGVKDAQTAFAQGDFPLLKGALWMLGGIKTKLKANNINESDLAALPLPFGGAGADSYAISAKTSGQTLNLAKKFMRFIATPEINAEIASKKTISNNKEGQKIQIAKFSSDPVYGAFLKFGAEVNNLRKSSPSDLINNIVSIYSDSTSLGLNYEWFQATFKNDVNQDERLGNGVNLNNYLDVINKGIKKYWSDRSIANPSDWKTKHPLV